MSTAKFRKITKSPTVPKDTGESPPPKVEDEENKKQIKD